MNLSQTLVLAQILSILCLSTVKTESFFQMRNREDNVFYRKFTDHNRVNNTEQAESFLRQYDYLKCGGENGTKCSKTEIADAVKQYQTNYHIPGKGRLDQVTFSIMSEPRCGNSDNRLVRPLVKPKRKRGKAQKKGGKHNVKHRRPRQTELDSTDYAEEIPSAPGDFLSNRQEWLQSYEDDLNSGELERRLRRQIVEVQRRRSKRSVRQGNSRSNLDPSVITWRLLESAYSHQLLTTDQRKNLALAFRMWSEVIPIIFVEDLHSPDYKVDVIVAFGKGEHMNCSNELDGFGGQLGHAVQSSRKEGAEIHIDDDEHLTVNSKYGTNLIKLALHEIGHVLGLNHTTRRNSIMYAIYSNSQSNLNLELDSEDRRAAQAIYGVCKGRFNTVFDWVRYDIDGRLIYNTYFFRGSRYWMYENIFKRTRFGDPLSIAPGWNGIPNDTDAYVHIQTDNFDDILFFKGKHYWIFNSTSSQNGTDKPNSIEKDFRAKPGSSFPNIPNNLDSVFFDNRDKNLYFFKGNLVYAYDVSLGEEGCCLPGYPRDLKNEYPHVFKKTGSRLPANLDAVYFSYYDKSMYFFKDQQYWQNTAFNISDQKRKNRVEGPFQISDKWADICEPDLLEPAK